MLNFENGNVAKLDQDLKSLVGRDVIDKNLEQLETIIKDGLNFFYTIGIALAIIRDKKLYKQRGFNTFESYCHEVWGISRPYAYETLRAGQVLKNLSGIPDIPRLPSSVSQALPLTKLKTANEQIEVWREIISKHEEPTAKQVKEEVAQRLTRNDSEQLQEVNSKSRDIIVEDVSDVQVTRNSDDKADCILLEVPTNRLNRIEVLRMFIHIGDEQFSEVFETVKDLL